MAKIYIDPGHGGNDPGAVANGIKEKDIVLDIAKRLRTKLNDYEGVQVLMTRTTDKFISLSERANMANRANADIFVSIHVNAGGGTGFESFIYNGNVSSHTKTLQSNIHKDIMAQIGGTDRGMKRANFAVLRQTKMPALLTENLFIDTKADADKLKDSSFLDKVAEGHAQGIANYLGLKKGNSTASNKSSGSSSKTSTSSANLTVDGKWGKATTRALQRALGTPVDGIISKQPRNSVSQSLYGNTIQFGSGASNVIIALQKKVGATADGKLGPATVRALQKYLGTVVDGVLSRPSLVVKEMQRRLNAGTF